MILILLICTAVVYVFQFTLLQFGLRRIRPLPQSAETAAVNIPPADLPTVSVVVAARNEERTIGRCIESILRNDYPAHLTEIVLVNDSSTDGTGGIMDAIAGRHDNITSLSVETESPRIRGKANALAQGIRRSTGSILLFTDADCEVPKTWIRKQVSYFEPSVGLVGGFTRLHVANWFSGMQAVDWFFLYSVAAAAAGVNRPLTAVGNNLCIRREAYDDTGGYENLPFSVTEDYILVDAVKKTGMWDIRFPMDPETLVASNACPTFKSLYRQKHRWATGGGDMQPGVFVLFAPVYIFYLLIVLFPVTGILPALAALAVKTASDAFFLYPALKAFNCTHLYRYLMQFELHNIAYVVLLPYQILSKSTVVWKDRVYEKK
jgi:cellulose synthase/poly-beta-1,6-N-acetylglucosamine synthase-like glycosyltransferase